MVKNLPACSIPGWGRSLGEGNGYPLQYSCLENPVDRGSGQATACGVRESQTRLSRDTHTHIHTLNTSKPHWLRASDICIFHSQGWGQVQLGSSLSFPGTSRHPQLYLLPVAEAPAEQRKRREWATFNV